MTNPLPDLQYRIYRSQFATYLDDNYEDWQDVTDLNYVYPTGTQLRVKPVVTYDVKDDLLVKPFSDRDQAINYMTGLVESGKTVSIKRVDKSKDLGKFLSDKKVQWCTPGTDRWQAMSYLNYSRFPNRVQLRIRPDEYFVVTVSNGMAQSDIHFEDVESLAKYLDNKVRTGMYNFSVKAVKYV